NAWTNNAQYFYTYNANNSRLSDLHQSWQNSNWVNSDSTHYYYHTVTGIAEENTAMRISAFPDPSGGIFTLSLPGNTGAYDLFITDVTGKTIFSSAGNTGSSRAIDLSGQPAGIYFCTVSFRNGPVSHAKIMIR
ncbi:MAG TPA: T9SS type A sorting domain-containing protein, partial [Bacteroidia bacterium]|nr:T9SS type A sorting domain-containing protein [Bacteroidia bacterium]